MGFDLLIVLVGVVSECFDVNVMVELNIYCPRCQVGASRMALLLVSSRETMPFSSWLWNGWTKVMGRASCAGVEHGEEARSSLVVGFSGFGQVAISLDLVSTKGGWWRNI